MPIKTMKNLTYIGLLLASGGALFAQTTTGGLAGKVVDAKGAPIKGVLVRVTSPVLALPRETRSDARGEWRHGLLPPGTYKVTVIKDGYYAKSADLYLGVGKTEALNIGLKAVEIAGATVEVVDATQFMEAKTEVKTSTNFQGEQLTALPGLRSYTDLMYYAPGVDSEGRVRGADGKSGIRYSVDGVDTRDDLAALNSGTSVSMVQPIYDSIQDLQLVQNSVNARNGRSLGSQYIMVTKRGGNEFTGSLRVYYSRESWRSNDSGSQASATSTGDNLTKAQWTWTLSGPIIKDRLSFFLSGITSPVIRGSGSLFSWDAGNYGPVSKLGAMTTDPDLEDNLKANTVAGSAKVLMDGPGVGWSPQVSTINVTVPQDTSDKQWDARISGAISADHNVDLKISRRDRGLTNVADAAGYAFVMQDPRLLGSYRQKNNSYSLSYTGVLTSSTMLEVNYSMGNYEVGTDSRTLDGAQVPVLAALESYAPEARAAGVTSFPSFPGDNLDMLPYTGSLAGSFATYQNLMSSVVSPVREKHRTNTLEVNLKTYVDLFGQHEIDAGFETYKMTYNPGTQFGQQNRVVYAGGWYQKGSDWLFPTVAFEGIGANNQQSALGPAPVMLEAWTKAADQENKTQGIWLNDQWAVNDRLNVNLGVRWNRYHMINGDGRTLGKSIAMEPRVLLRWDPKGNAEHLFTLSFTRNAQGFSSAVAASLATNPQNYYTLRGWTGNGTQPTLSSLGSSGTDNGQYGVRFVSYADLINTSNYAAVPYVFVNRGVTTRIQDMTSPYADQVELTYTHNLSDATSVRLSLVDKRFHNELMQWTDYNWENLALSTDPSGRSGGEPQWLQVSNYGSSSMVRIFQDAELSIEQKLTSRLSWNLAWSYFYEYTPDEQGRRDYATVKGSAYNPYPASAYLADGVTQRTHRATSILTYVQPLGKGSIVYTLAGTYAAAGPSLADTLKSTYTLYGMTPDKFLNVDDPAHNPNGYQVQYPGSWGKLPIYYATPGNWKTGRDSFTMGFSVSWNIPLGIKKMMFVGTASVSDLFHRVSSGGGWGSSGPISDKTKYMPNGRVLGQFIPNGMTTPVGWGSKNLPAYYQGISSSTRPVSNLSAGIRF